MTLKNIEKLFEQYSDKDVDFNNIPPERRLSNRRDLNAFILLDKLFPVDQEEDMADIISACEHDVAYIDISDKQIKTLTEENIHDLVASGIYYDSEFNCLVFFR